MMTHTKQTPLNWLLFLVVVSLSSLFSSTVFAEEIPISVKAILPDNQVAHSTGYYDLMMTPGQKQTLEFEVYNSGTKEVSLNLAIHPAFTGDGGALDYTREAQEKDESLKIPLTDIATVDKNISVPAQGSAKVGIQLAMPQENFEGIILGAVRVTQVEDEGKEAEGKEKTGISIENKFAYVVAIRLQTGVGEVTSDLKLKSIGASQVAGRNTVKAQVQNPTMSLIEEVSYDAKIYQKNGDEVLHQNQVENYRVAPNTLFNFPISWENKAFKAGTYTLKMVVSSAKTKQEWVFDQDFTISAEEAKELNANAAELETDYSHYLLYGGIAFAVLIIGFGSALVLITRKNKKRRNRRKSSSKGHKRSSSSKGSSSSSKKKKGQGKR